MWSVSRPGVEWRSRHVPRVVPRTPRCPLRPPTHAGRIWRRGPHRDARCRTWWQEDRTRGSPWARAGAATRTGRHGAAGPCPGQPARCSVLPPLSRQAVTPVPARSTLSPTPFVAWRDADCGPAGRPRAAVHRVDGWTAVDTVNSMVMSGGPVRDSGARQRILFGAACVHHRLTSRPVRVSFHAVPDERVGDV